MEPSTTGLLRASKVAPAPLSDQQVRFFRAAGYLRLPTRFETGDIEALRAQVLTEIADAREPVRRDEAGNVVRASRLFERHPLFREALTSPLVLGPLSAVLGPNIEYVCNRHNHATLDNSRSKAARLHRDVLQWSRPIVTVLLYLDDSDEATGCTHVIPTSHYLPFVGTPNNGGTWMDEHSVYADLSTQAVPVPMRAGELLLLDSLAFHSAGTNRSGRDRVAITAAYHSVDELRREHDGDRQLVLGTRLFRGDS